MCKTHSVPQNHCYSLILSIQLLMYYSRSTFISSNIRSNKLLLCHLLPYSLPNLLVPFVGLGTVS